MVAALNLSLLIVFVFINDVKLINLILNVIFPFSEEVSDQPDDPPSHPARRVDRKAQEGP